MERQNNKKNVITGLGKNKNLLKEKKLLPYHHLHGPA
jgi:hypothetical protein